MDKRREHGGSPRMGASDCHLVYTDSVPPSRVRAGSWPNRSYGRSRANRGPDEPVIQPCVHQDTDEVFTFSPQVFTLAPNVFSPTGDVFTSRAIRPSHQSQESRRESRGLARVGALEERGNAGRMGTRKSIRLRPDRT